jgi:hypothetical protein
MRNNNLLFSIINEDGIIYNPSTKRSHTLSKPALVAWKLWDGEHSLQEVVEQISLESGDDPEQVMRDIVNCAAELFRHGLLNDVA